MHTKLFTTSILGCVALLSNCQTEDPRIAVSPGTEPATDSAVGNEKDNDFPRGLGGLCGEDTPECDDGLSCHEGTCTPTAYVEACTPNPCGESGVCNARGEIDEDGDFSEEDLVLICRCPNENEEWDGTTCLGSADENGYPKFSGSLLDEGETCPGPEVQVGVPGATDCSDGAFCNAEGGGQCLEYNFSLVGVLADQNIDISTAGEESTTVECTREYFDAVVPEEGDESTEPSGQSYGVKLVITGALAEQISAGAPSITITLTDGDTLDGLPRLVFPQTDSPKLRTDSVFASLDIDTTELAAIGGQFTLDSVSGPDEDEDNLIDDNEGAIGGTFFLGLPDKQFLAGAFVVPCGANESRPLPEE